ncbi:exo-alpha-sialidase [Pontibacter sp. 172403-2]|uniref:sialidase family protein n=1 Tax=Pontibacter rufus TaxID=2791028 RepID=UPI0018AF8BF4|nr:sialidase family protein [Pontibacter sp. 172403-2]MBF9252698.1 exo-alpha-sialidase [Pontibacter sp. 172403-2]
MLLVLINSIGCAKQVYTTTAQPQQEIKVSSTAPTVPVLKGMNANPLLRVLVYVPAGNDGITYRNLHATLNEDAVRAIQKLDVYFTDTEPLFATNNLLASVRPSSTSFDIPVNIQLAPGMHYIWFSATLKETADIKDKIELHVTQLTDAENKVWPVAEDSSAYAKRMGVAVRKAGDDGVDTYRIPGIATTDKGTLIAVYDIRYNNSGDLPGNIDVGMSRSTDGGNTWEPMRVIMDMGAPHENNGVGDPAILFDPATNKLWVAALWSKGDRSIRGSKPGLSPDETGQLVLASSSDDGLTWSAPYSITPQVKNPAWNLFFQGPGNGTVMQDGTLVFPAQYWDENAMPYSTIIYSKDHGQSWTGSIAGPKPNTTESQVVETTPGTLMLNMRDNRGRFRSVATSSDMGKNWVEHHTSYNALPDPVNMGSLIKAKVNVHGVPKEVLFFSNANASYGRHDITIKASLDLGETWKPANQALVDERNSYGYSSLTKIDDNTIGILYEGIKDLYFVRVPVSEILE